MMLGGWIMVEVMRTRRLRTAGMGTDNVGIHVYHRLFCYGLSLVIPRAYCHAVATNSALSCASRPSGNVSVSSKPIRVW